MLEASGAKYSIVIISKHLVGAGEKRGPDREAQRVGRFEVDYKRQLPLP